MAGEGEKVLITGASGVVGRAVQADLEETGYEVVALSSADADLRDPKATNELFDRVRPSSVVHLAARVRGIMGNAGRQGEMFLDNLLINTNAIEASRRSGVRKFLAMGSTAMYSDETTRPMSEVQLLHGEPHPSELGYSHAKRTMLTQLELYKEQFGLDFALCVGTNMYGPHDRFDEGCGHVLPSLVSKFERAMREGSAVSVWGTGRATRDFLYAEDAASGIRTVLDSGSGVINLASGNAVTIRQTVELLASVVGFRAEIIWDRTKPDGQLDRSYDVSRLKALGWVPRVSLAEGLAATMDWYRANRAVARR